MSKRDDIKMLLAGNNITSDIMKKQKKIFGFSIFMLEKTSMKEIIKNVLHYFGPSLNKVTSMIEIPHTYIFGLIFGGMLLRGIVWMYIGGEYFTIGMGRTILDQIMDVILILIVLGITYIIFRKVQELSAKKMKLLYKSLIFYNYSMDETIKLLLELDPGQKKQKNKYRSGGFTDGFGGKWGLFAFSQPFIFGHGYLFSGFGFWALVFFDIFVWLLLFQKMRTMIMYILIYYFKIKFYFMDHFSFLFGIEIQERAFYKKLYYSIGKLDEKLIILEKNVISIKEGIITKNLGKGLTKTIVQIGKLYDLVNTSKYLNNKHKFHAFLKDLLNEAIDDYIEVFEALKNHKETVLSNNTKIPLVMKRLELYQKQLDNIQGKIFAMKIEN